MRRALIISLLCMLPLWGSAGNTGFLTQRLQQIALADGLVVPDYRGEPIAKCTFIKESKVYPVVVEFDSKEIIHIGLDIFGPEIKKENPIIYRFVERYMLELLALYTPSEAKGIMNSDGVSVTGNVNQVLNKDMQTMKVVYSTSNDTSGTVTLGNAGGSSLFSITFPLSISLLSGMDKVELDAYFFFGLRQTSPELRRAIPNNLSRIGKNLYVSENGFYVTPAVQNSSFFQKHRSAFSPVCESRLSKESVMTLLTAYIGTRQYIVHLTLHAYNYSKVEVDVPLTQLLNYCLESGCTPYVGIEECDETVITASLFMVNDGLGYCHTFKFTVDIGMLDSETGIFNASAYSFTPVHNLKK